MKIFAGEILDCHDNALIESVEMGSNFMYTTPLDSKIPAPGTSFVHWKRVSLVTSIRKQKVKFCLSSEMKSIFMTFCQYLLNGIIVYHLGAFLENALKKQNFPLFTEHACQ